MTFTCGHERHILPRCSQVHIEKTTGLFVRSLKATCSETGPKTNSFLPRFGGLQDMGP